VSPVKYFLHIKMHVA